MKVYFSCSITGRRDDQPVYQQLVEALLEDGHTVPTAHLAEDKSIPIMKKFVEAGDIFQRDTAWVKECDVVVAEVSTPSHGVGYEIALAEFAGKPLFFLLPVWRDCFKDATGNPSPLY